MSCPPAQPGGTPSTIVPTIVSDELPSSTVQSTSLAPALNEPVPLLPTLSVELPLSPIDLLSTPAEGEAGSYKPSMATHADRNPSSFVQPARKLAKLSDAQKASQKLRRKIEQDEHQRLIEEFDILLDRHVLEQEELAKRHNVKPEYLKKLKDTSKHFKVKRGVNLENAKIHKKSIEMNAGM